jgi:hypothetical protein
MCFHNIGYNSDMGYLYLQLKSLKVNIEYYAKINRIYNMRIYMMLASSH